jgi:RHS repeat-associated protein
VAIYSRNSAGTNTVNYVLEDHQGSIASIITNSTPGPVADYVSESFTAYGNRRSGETWSGAPSSGDETLINGVSRQGYTWQTALGASMGLNHMNGRVQDAITGRFLSPDPNIPNPRNTQSWNRYSYVNNNPLTLIDPSGFDDMSGNCPDGGCGSAGGGGGGGDVGGGDVGGGNVGGGDVGGGDGGGGADQLPDVGCGIPPYGPCTQDPTPPFNIPTPTLTSLWPAITFGGGPSAPKPTGSAAKNPAQSQNPIKTFLCQNSGGDSLAQQAADTVGNGGTAADSVRPLVAIGATAAGTSNVAYPQATSFLGSQAVSALSAIGKAGQLASAGGIFYSLITGDYQAALYGTADYFAYSALSDFGAASAIPTAGLGTATAGAAALLYYNAGGSQGLVQGAICP